MIIKMNPLLLEDIFVEICCTIARSYIDLFSRVNHFGTIINMEKISKWHMSIIRKNKWSDLTLSISNDINMLLMLRTHNFQNIYCLSDISDTSAIKLVNCYKLDLSSTKVTDKSISKLINVHTLNLAYTHITNLGILGLNNVHTLNLSNTDITDVGILGLINVHTLILSCCTKITGKNLSKLKKLHTLCENYSL